MITNLPSRQVRGKTYLYSELWYTIVDYLHEEDMLCVALKKYMELHDSFTRVEFIDFVCDKFIGNDEYFLED